MPLVHIRHVFVFTIWVCASIIPITMAFSWSTADTDSYGAISRSIRSGQSDQDKFRITCPKYCSCSRTLPDFAITVRCTKLIDETHTRTNIAHFVLETEDDLVLGPDAFRTSGLDRLKSIAIIHPYEYSNPIIIETFPYFIWIAPTYEGTLNIDPDIFQNNSQLNFLAIYQIQHFINSCDSTQNYLFDAPSLTRLLFSVWDYDCWPLSTFTKMTNLTDIYLQSPKFKLQPGIFAPVQKLIKLEIHKAQYVENIGEDDFIGVSLLETLVIGNNIRTVHEDAFLHLMQLKCLDTSYNMIETFTQNHLRNNSRLEVLRMSYNENLGRLPVFKLSSANNNTYSIHEFHCSQCGLESITNGTFNAMPALKTLDLSGNWLETLPQDFFKPLSSLQSLDLSRNLISYIPDHMFEGATKLSNLNLHGNPLTVLQWTPFLPAPELSNLDLSNCQIKVWSAASLPINSLRSLSLLRNELEHITVKHLMTTPGLSKLEILYNPINCDDELDDSIEWSLSHNVTTQFFGPDHLYCIPNDDEFCWDDFQKVICNPNYISGIGFNKQDHRGDQQINNRSKVEVYNENIRSITPLIFITITVTTFFVSIMIIKFRAWKTNSKDHDIMSQNNDIVHNPAIKKCMVDNNHASNVCSTIILPNINEKKSNILP